MSDESRKARQVTVGEHDYARAPQFTWPGEVVLGEGASATVIPGTWSLEWSANALVRPARGDAIPSPTDAVAWRARVAQVMTLAEPGVQLRVVASAAHGWERLAVTVPSAPPSVVEFDRGALAEVGGVSALALRVLV